MKSKVWRRIVNVFLGLLLLIGLVLIFANPIRTGMVQYLSRRQLNAVTATQIQKNQKKKADFDFDKVKDLDTKQIAKAVTSGDVIGLGKLAVPSVGMVLPVMKGVSEATLAQGGGTMKADQKMGAINNYALAGHSFQNIFLPLAQVKVGANIYLTDLKQVYTYRIFYKKSISPYDVDVIDDVPGKRMVTLITCDNTVRRWCVQGELTQTQKATTKTLSVFER